MAFRGERLRALRKKMRLSQGELGSMVGLSQKSISDLENGATMETTKLHALARVCGVSPEWLLGSNTSSTGIDVSPDSETISSSPPSEFWQVQGRGVRIGVVDTGAEGTQVAAVVGNVLRVQELDVRGGASYGGGIVDEEHIENGRQQPKVVANWGLPSEFVESELGLRSADMDIIKVRGDSMDDGSARGLSSGDRVMVDRGDRDVRQGGIFVVFDGAGIIIKQVELDREAQPPRIVCKSLNGRYSPINLTLEEPVHVIGRVAARISRM